MTFLDKFSTFLIIFVYFLFLWWSASETFWSCFSWKKLLHQPHSLLLQCHSAIRCPTCFPRAWSGRSPQFCAPPFPWSSLQRWWSSSYLSHTVGATFYTYHTSSQVRMPVGNTGQLWNISTSHLIYSNVMASCTIKSSSCKWLIGAYGGLLPFIWGHKAILRGKKPSTTKYGFRY